MMKSQSFYLILTLLFAGCGSSKAHNAQVAEPPPLSSLGKIELELDLSTPPVVLANLGTFPVDTITTSRLDFNASAGNICDPIFYDTVQYNFNFDNLYRVTTQTNKVYYFRFGWQSCEGHTSFLNTAWANGSHPSETGMMTFDLVQKDIVQTGTIELSTIGDSITWWNDGEALRRMMALYNPDLKFVGSRTDIYAYGHEGEGGNTTQDVINRIDRIRQSDNYLVLIGTNDLCSEDATLDNMKKIADQLLNKKAGAIVYYLTILPRIDPYYDSKNQIINDKLRAWITSANNPRIKLLDIEPDFRGLADWQALLPDAIHPNMEGYDRLVRIILSKGGWL